MNVNLFISCPKGLEQLLLDELQNLGCEQVKQTVGGVYCETLWEDAYKICLHSRLANRVIWILADEEVNNKEELFQRARNIYWSGCFSQEKTFAVDFKGKSRFITHTNYGSMLIKDAVVDHFKEDVGTRPNVNPKAPDVQIYAHLRRNRFIIGIDLSGGSLHKRGYRLEGAKAPLKENLAAALALRAGVEQGVEKCIVDPFCGSATLLVESVLLMKGIAPGLLKASFGFEHLIRHNAKVWDALLDEAKAARDTALEDETVLAYGYDQDHRVIEVARENVKRAGLEKLISLKPQSFHDLKVLPEWQKGILLTNPPYGERLKDQGTLASLYRAMGEKLKSEFQGWRAAVLSSDDFLLKSIALKKTKLYKFYNGALEVEWVLFDIFEKSESQQEPVQDDKFKQAVEMVSNRLRKNRKRLKKWADKEQITSYRLYDADMPEYAFALDLYGDKYQITEYVPPKSVDEFAAWQRRQHFIQAVREVFEVSDKSIFIKERKKQKGQSQYEKLSNQQHFFTVQEGQGNFLINLNDYLDTGLFLDHRLVRLKIAQMAKGKSFLNLFCYTSAASVHAAVGGATSSLSVDMSKTYLAWSERNFKKNRLDLTKHRVLRADVKKWLSGEGRDISDETFDLIFLDPPSFSNSKKMDGTLDVQRDQIALIEGAMKKLNSGGTLIFSNNRRGFKLDQSIIDNYAVEDITAQTIDKDFERNSKIHTCWLIKHKAG